VTPEASEGDDNPDITDYLGYTDLNIYYRFWNNHNLHLMVRGNLNTGKGGMSLSYSFPVPRSQRSFVDFRLTQGYGESLVDYKKSLTRIGVGIMFVQ
jgi:phospholipase A1